MDRRAGLEVFPPTHSRQEAIPDGIVKRSGRWRNVIESACVMSSIVAALPLYALRSSEVRSFLASHEHPLPINRIVIVGSVMTWLGWRHLRATGGLRIPIGVLEIWLLAAIAAAVYPTFFGTTASYEVVAYLILVPLWLNVPEWVRDIRRLPAKSPSLFRTWILVALSGAVVFWAGTIVQAIFTFMVHVMPPMPLEIEMQIVARSSLHLSVFGAAFIAICILGCGSMRLISRHLGSRASFFFRVSCVTIGALAVSGIILNGIRAIDADWLAPRHLVFAIWNAVPLTLFTARNLATSRTPDLASAILGYGQARLEFVPGFGKTTAGDKWFTRFAAGLSLFMIFFAIQWTVRGWHIKYGWGVATAILYDVVAIGSAAYLFTIVQRNAQVQLIRLGLFILACLNVYALVDPVSAGVWDVYSKYDQPRRAAQKVWYHLLPNQQKELVQLRQRILESMHYRGENMQAHWPVSFTAANPSRLRPNVLVIIVDSLRRDSYDAEKSSGLPGLEFIGKRFVEYANAWTSYNATIGSMPAFFAGAFQPVWYQAKIEDGVHHRNTLADGLKAAGYTIYHDAEGLELDYYWPDPGKPFVTPGGKGLGDPGHILPQTAELLKPFNTSENAQPRAVYLHLYNVHAPLLHRDGTAFSANETNWMRAMYDHNVHYLDQSLDRFFRDLDASGILDDTLVVLTADHGEELFDLGGLYHGWQLNPFVLAVPLYVHYPAGTPNAPAPGTVMKQGANLVDVVPTIMSVIGMDMPRETNLQGVDLRRLPTLPSRIFPALSWQSMLVGLIHSDQQMLEVVESESGQTEAYSLHAGQWSLEEPERSAVEIGAEISKLLGAIHARWH